MNYVFLSYMIMQTKNEILIGFSGFNLFYRSLQTVLLLYIENYN